MLLTLLTCLVWTTWLIVVALKPNETANWLMSTGAYDNGQFWLISDKTPRIVMAGAAGLAVVDACYLHVLVKMLRWRDRVDEVATFYHLTTPVDTNKDSVIMSIYRRCRHIYTDLTSFAGSKRKVWVSFVFSTQTKLEAF